MLHPTCQAVASGSSPRGDPATLVGLLRQRAHERPDQHAYTFLDSAANGPAALTYQELDKQARAIAARLQQMGGIGQRALLLYPPGLEFVAAFLGCLSGGIVAVPVQPMTSERGLPRLLSIARDARAAFVLTTTKLLGRLQASAGRLPELDAISWLATDQISPALAEDWQDPQPEAETLAFLQYTSGSTASPKGVRVSHGNLLHNEEMIRRAFGQSAESVIVGWLPLYHDMGLIGNVLQPLYLGAHAILMSPATFLKRPLSWLEAITRYRATTSGGPNFAYELCVRKIGVEQRAGLDLSSWEVAFNGAEPVRADALDRFARAFAPQGFRRSAFYPCYGLAEATLFVTGGGKGSSPVAVSMDRPSLERGEAVYAPAEEPGDCRLVGCGHPWMEQRVAIVDPESRRLLGEDRIGEVWVAGPSVAQGYWGRPEETKRDFRAHLADAAETGQGPFLRTGDLGFLRNGELFVTGRLKDLIILRGRNLYPQDLELSAERSHPELRLGCSAAFPVEVGSEERLVVACELEHRARSPYAAVVEAIRQAITEEHEIQPHEVVLLETGTIPKTSSGKIQRHACRARYLAGELAVRWRSLRDMPSEAERGALNSTGSLGEEVARILGLPSSSVDPQKPLTVYGLDSLAAVEIQHAMESRLGASVDLSELLRGITLQQLAAKVLTAAVGERPQDVPAPMPASAAGAPLSYGQRALWFLQRLQPANAAYNITAAADVRSQLDPEALRRSLELLTWKHEALRYAFVETEAGPVQRVCPGRTLEFSVEDAAGWSPAQLDVRLRELACRPFDLERDPLLRVTVFRTSQGEHTLLLVVHHIIADLWSLALLAEELGELYSRRSAGEPPAVPSLRFTDYVAWQERLVAGERGESLWAYWRERLHGELPVLDLPSDRPRPSLQTFNGDGCSLAISGDLLERIKALGARRGATLYVTLLAAFQILLHRHGAQEDVLVGSPTSGRSSAALTDLVGYFANPVVLRSDLSGRPAFLEFLAQVREAALEAFAHQDYPFPLLVERLQPERDPSRSPLFQALFVLERAHLRNGGDLSALALGEPGVRIELGGLTLESRRIGRSTAQLDLELLAAETGDGLGLVLVYNSDLFDAGTAEHLLGHLRTLLAGAVDNPERQISELPLLSASESHQLLAEWNDTAAIPADTADDRCLHELYTAQASATPEAVAMVCGSSRQTYGELERRANRLANHLLAMGVGAETPVGVCLERGPDLVPALLGILKAGAAYVPLDPAYPQERLDLLLEDARVPVLVTQSSLASRFPAVATHVLMDAEQDTSAVAPGTEVDPDQIAYFIYTSGSTGRPKGVAITHRSAVALVRWALDRFSQDDLAGVLASTSICFDLSIFELFVPLSRGGTVLLADDALALPELPAAEQVTLINTVP
ncbi:MAG TPA: AMP-binding protein, partial [Thermoanaerobaculia bacterium]|nr:AMP-binding protein [Thermoanaerobaculia bacterium]